MAAVEDDQPILRGRLVRHTRDLREREAVVPFEFRWTEIAVDGVQVTVPGEVEERDFAVVAEQLHHSIAEARPGDGRPWASGREDAYIEVDRAVAVAGEHALHAICVIHAAVQ